VTGVAGGITEDICLVRCKGCFGRPTSGGWADIEFRAALELCEKVGVDPEEGGDTDILDALVWALGQQKTSVSETPKAVGSSHAESAFSSKLESNHSSRLDGLMTIIQAQNESFQAQNERFQAQNERQNDKIAALEIQISSLLCTQAERFEPKR
jgi:hypothetical protein